MTTKLEAIQRRLAAVEAEKGGDAMKGFAIALAIAISVGLGYWKGYQTAWDDASMIVGCDRGLVLARVPTHPPEYVQCEEKP